MKGVWYDCIEKKDRKYEVRVVINPKYLGVEIVQSIPSLRKTQEKDNNEWHCQN